MNELQKAINILEGVASSWNGKDEIFTYEGELYQEEHAQMAIEALEVLEGYRDTYPTLKSVHLNTATLNYPL